MVRSTQITAALGAICLSLSLFAAAAQAEGPATVTVRVEGVNETLVPATPVTTTTTPVVSEGKSEDTCRGTSALGALQLATAGDWAGPWDAGFSQYEVYSIDGESHAFGSGFYWGLWTNHAESPVGACGAELESGEEVLFFPCSEEVGCDGPLGITAPADAVAGSPVGLTIEKYSSSGASSAVAGATVTATLAGSAVTSPVATAITGSGGEVTVTFPSAGDYVLSASAPEAIRTEASVCVEAKGGGTCVKSQTLGTGGSSSSGGSGGSGTSSTTSSKTAPRAFIASLLGLAEEHVYRAGHAPRVLQGYASTGGAPRELKLRLTRRAGARGRGPCSYYDGTTDTFRSMPCGAQHGKYFSIPPVASFSYLLPGALAPGRYVLDLEATGANGVHTKLERGSTRFVFYVR